MHPQTQVGTKKQNSSINIYGLGLKLQIKFASQGLVLIQRSATAVILSANGCAAFSESCALNWLKVLLSRVIVTQGSRISRGRLNIKMSSYLCRIPMLKIRQSRDRLIFNTGIPIPGKDGLYIKTGPRFSVSYCSRCIPTTEGKENSQSGKGYHLSTICADCCLLRY